METIRIGTRGSKLALWQAYYVEKKLQAAGATTEIIKIETKGDKILDKALSKIGSKGLFTEELETALREKSIDIAVHSAKDMPSSLPEDLPLLAFTAREKANDVLVSYQKGIKLTENASFVLGTSSVRRTALVKHFFPKVKLVDMRGNLQTRMAKLERGDCDALLLAFAGVHRMKYDEHIVQHLPETFFTPAVGQGSIAIQIFEGINPTLKTLCYQTLANEKAMIALSTERSFLYTLEGGCSVPAFGWAEVQQNEVIFHAGVISLDGKRIIRETQHAPLKESQKLGEQVAQSILSKGGREILDAVKKQKSSPN